MGRGVGKVWKSVWGTFRTKFSASANLPKNLGGLKKVGCNFCLKVEFQSRPYITSVLYKNIVPKFDSNSDNIISIPDGKLKKQLENFARNFAFFSNFAP